MKSLVSIIMPSYNSSEFISKAVFSVISQTYTNWELLIVDDCSTDKTVELIRAFIRRDSRISLMELDCNSGPAVARNKGIERAKGRFIAFLDSDDLWMNDKLEKQLAFMQSNDYPFTYAAYDRVDDRDQVIGNIGVFNKVSYFDLLKTCSIGCLTAIYDTEFFGKVFMPTNTKREDYATWLQLLKKVDYAYGINESLAEYRVYRNQSSAKKAQMAKANWRLYRQIEGLSLIKAVYYFSHYAVLGLLRAKAPSIARLLGVLR